MVIFVILFTFSQVFLSRTGATRTAY